MREELIIFTDGASLGNPGKAGVGWVVKKRGETILRKKASLGFCTNNVAEYAGVIFGLVEGLVRGEKRISLYLDSELVVKQLKGEWRVRDRNLKIWYNLVAYLKGFFEKVSFNYIPREKNREADRLAHLGARES